MGKSVRSTHFIPEWIDLGPWVPVPKTDWIKEKEPDVAYGDAPLQKLDLYYPNEQKASYSVVILVHGGGFMGCDKRDWHLYPGFYALRAGFALVSVNYRLAPADPFPAAVEDLKSAIHFLRKNAAQFRLDPDNFFLYGTSAGGNLVTYTGLDGGSSRGLPDDYRVNAVAALCPLINFSNYFNQTIWIAPLVPGIRKMMKGYLGACRLRPGIFGAGKYRAHSCVL
jgi:acetyl esterase/lipase